MEVDETYVGGRPRNGMEPGRTGRGTRKMPVLALVGRDGGVRATPVERVNAETLKGTIQENVDRTATVVTGEWAAYKGIGKEFAGGH
jgi:ISXO2-like transposase domain